MEWKRLVQSDCSAAVIWNNMQCCWFVFCSGCFSPYPDGTIGSARKTIYDTLVKAKVPFPPADGFFGYRVSSFLAGYCRPWGFFQARPVALMIDKIVATLTVALTTMCKDYLPNWLDDFLSTRRKSCTYFLLFVLLICAGPGESLQRRLLGRRQVVEGDRAACVLAGCPHRWRVRD